MRRAPKHPNPSLQPPLTVDEPAPALSWMSNERLMEQLKRDPLHLDQTTREALSALTAEQRKIVAKAETEQWQAFVKAVAVPAKAISAEPSGLAGPLGRIFGTAGSVIGSIVDVTASAFKRVNDDLQHALAQRDEARADARALYDAYMSSTIPPQEMLQRVATYAARAKTQEKFNGK
jgi:hypothetical protein